MSYDSWIAVDNFRTTCIHLANMVAILDFITKLRLDLFGRGE